ncbi:MAG TPA: ABC transporter permease [Chloroflexia bacterium]|nr:ABC transporter permease [Chloroflexia bacterium]
MFDFPLTKYLFDHFDVVWERMVEHLVISGTSLGIALLISLPLGLLLSRVRVLATPVLGLLGIIYTIPSFAFFAVLVGFVGIGAQPAIIALTSYALVILVRNIMVAFNSVDPAVKEAARGMGMNGGQVLWRIEVPLALPIVIAGVRIAALSTIALTTIGAWIGAGTLGQLLRDGLPNPSTGKLYAGVIAIAAIAIATDILFRLVERLANPTRKPARRIQSATPQPISGLQS